MGGGGSWRALDGGGLKRCSPRPNAARADVDSRHDMGGAKGMTLSRATAAPSVSSDGRRHGRCTQSIVAARKREQGEEAPTEPRGCREA
eukprot:11188189-Alexandrium_andersonii.AAC.1